MSNRPALPLADDDVQHRLALLPGWALQQGKLHRRFRFSGFPAAFGFMAACATVAQAMDHHPEWSNVYDQVDVALSTHEAGGLTAKDFALAQQMSALAAHALA